jgi:hypothetical protein
MKRILLAALLVVPACKAEKSLQRAAMEPAAAVERSAGQAPQSAASTTTQPAQPQTRMIIRNATMSVVVRDAVDVLQKITALVDAKGGYVADTRQWKERE